MRTAVHYNSRHEYPGACEHHHLPGRQAADSRPEPGGRGRQRDDGDNDLRDFIWKFKKNRKTKTYSRKDRNLYCSEIIEPTGKDVLSNYVDFVAGLLSPSYHASGQNGNHDVSNVQNTKSLTAVL